MQTLVQVICSGGPSLRDAIIKDDRRLSRNGLAVQKTRKTGRSNGWTEILSTDPAVRGALKIQWDKHAHVLQCRVVNRRGGTPDRLVGDFVAYLFRYRRRILVINVVVPGR